MTFAALPPPITPTVGEATAHIHSHSASCGYVNQFFILKPRRGDILNLNSRCVAHSAGLRSFSTLVLGFRCAPTPGPGSPAEHLGWAGSLYAVTRSAGWRGFGCGKVAPLTAHCSLLTAHCSPLTAHCSVPSTWPCQRLLREAKSPGLVRRETSTPRARSRHTPAREPGESSSRRILRPRLP